MVVWLAILWLQYYGCLVSNIMLTILWLFGDISYGCLWLFGDISYGCLWLFGDISYGCLWLFGDISYGCLWLFGDISYGCLVTSLCLPSAMTWMKEQRIAEPSTLSLPCSATTLSLPLPQGMGSSIRKDTS